MLVATDELRASTARPAVHGAPSPKRTPRATETYSAARHVGVVGVATLATLSVNAPSFHILTSTTHDA